MNKIIARALTRTRRHAPTHTQVCTNIHPRTRQRMLAYTRLYTHALPHAYLRTRNACLHTRPYTHALTHAHPRTRERMLAHTPIHTRIRQRAFAHAYTYTRICMNLHIRTHMRVVLPHLHTSAHTLLLAHPHARVYNHSCKCTYIRCLHAHTNGHSHKRQHAHTQPAHVYVHATHARMQLSASLYLSHAPIKCKSMHFCMSAFMRMIDFTC